MESNARYRLGIATWFLGQRNPAAAAVRAFELGFRVLHVDFGTPGGIGCLEGTTLLEFCNVISGNGMEVDAIALNCIEQIGYTSSDSSLYATCQTLVARAADAAVALGSRALYVPSFHKNAIRDDVGLRRTAALLRYACDVSAASSMHVASENGLNADSNMRLVELVGNTRFRLLLDNYNSVLHGIQFCELVSAFVPHLCDTVHLKDGIDHGRFSVGLGTGEGCVTDSLHCLNSKQFRGTIVLENDYRGNDESAATDAAAIIGALDSMSAIGSNASHAGIDAADRISATRCKVPNRDGRDSLHDEKVTRTVNRL